MVVESPVRAVEGLRVGVDTGVTEGKGVGTGVGLPDGLIEGPTGAEDGVAVGVAVLLEDGQTSYNVSNISTSCSFGYLMIMMMFT
jgi:hypothetical protein